MKKKINSLLLFLILIIVIQSCNGSSNPITPINSDFMYPIKVGNKWSYHISNVYSNIQPDSIKNLLSDFFFDVQVFVTKDTLLDSSQVYEMKEESNDYADSYAYYSNKVEGFLKYAYSNSPSHGLPKANTVNKFLFRGNYFNSITELIKVQEETTFKLKILNDSLIFFHPPRIIYMYPLEVGKEWVFNQEFILINKEIVGKETVKTNSGNFECFKLKWKYDFDMDGIWDENFVLYEYVSAKGILKSVYTIKDITITSTEHPDGVGKADVKYERILTGTNF